MTLRFQIVTVMLKEESIQNSQTLRFHISLIQLRIKNV